MAVGLFGPGCDKADDLSRTAHERGRPILYLRLAAANAAALAVSGRATSALGQPEPPPEVRSSEAPHLMLERRHGQAFRSDAVEIVLAPPPIAQPLRWESA